MPIRMTRCNNRHQEAKVIGSEGIAKSIFAVSAARDAGPPRILCG